MRRLINYLLKDEITRKYERKIGIGEFHLNFDTFENGLINECGPLISLWIFELRSLDSGRPFNERFDFSFSPIEFEHALNERNAYFPHVGTCDYFLSIFQALNDVDDKSGNVTANRKTTCAERKSNFMKMRLLISLYIFSAQHTRKYWNVSFGARKEFPSLDPEADKGQTLIPKCADNRGSDCELLKWTSRRWSSEFRCATDFAFK